MSFEYEENICNKTYKSKMCENIYNIFKWKTQWKLKWDFIMYQEYLLYYMEVKTEKEKAR
jgi:hypothetical protein